MTEEWTEEKIEAEKGKIDQLSQEEMARLWRFSPSGHIYFRTDLPFYDHFAKRFKGFNPTLSKKIGLG